MEFKTLYFFSDKIHFNKDTTKYIRIMTDHPVFYAKINYNGKSQLIRFHSDSITSNTFGPHKLLYFSIVRTETKNIKKDFSNSYSLDNNENFISKRLMAYQAHLILLDKERKIDKRILKMHKRLLQCAMLVRQYIGEEIYNEIYNYIAEYQNNRDVQLLNEYENILESLNKISSNNFLYLKLQKEGYLQSAYSQLLSVIKEMKNRGNINKQSIEKYKNFVTTDIKQYVLLDEKSNLQAKRTEVFNEKFQNTIYSNLIEDYYSFVKDSQLLNTYIQTVEEPYLASGFHKIEYYWLDANTIAVIRNDFTDKIKDTNKFLKDNNLPEVNVKFVNKSQNNDVNQIHKEYVRYNPTEKENENFLKLKNSMLTDKKKNFKLHKKRVFLR